MEKKCIQCNALFKTRSGKKEAKRKFCSHNCYWESLKNGKLKEATKKKISLSLTGKKGSKGRIGIPQTEETKKKISLAHKGKKRARGVNSNNWKGGKPKCKICEKTVAYNVKICRECFIERGRKRLIDKKKKIEYNKKHKKRAWNYIEDRTKLKKSPNKMNDCQYKDWVKIVRTRDNNKCRLLDKDCNGRLETHHIYNWVDYPKKRYDINNGITLCKHHHPRGRCNEKSMIKKLIKIIC